ncbi:hypothetical protein ACFXDO_33445 [Streptomyces nigra]|uniref:hypothetical protein n=1 Tax=Streptomyces nigra TaxID=1827580 RepID=UPI0036B14BEA
MVWDVLDAAASDPWAFSNSVRLEPSADVAAVTTVQIREAVERLLAAGQWRPVTRMPWPCWTRDTTPRASLTCWATCPSSAEAQRQAKTVYYVGQADEPFVAGQGGEAERGQLLILAASCRWGLTMCDRRGMPSV